MKRLICLAITVCILSSGCSSSKPDTAFQTSTIDALLAGVYDGETSLSNLVKHGGFGIGTFDGLDGEMVVLDGKVYQVRADGKVYTPLHSSKTPFATVCCFNPDKSFGLVSGATFKNTKEEIDKIFSNKNLFYAVKLTGTFSYMKTRSVPAQVKPYPPLKEVTKNQPQFTMKNVEGTIVGFRCPAFVKGVNVPGYHLHFLSRDKKQGGHILDFTIDKVKCEVDMLDKYILTLPSKVKAFANTDLTKDRSKELKAVEKGD
jgi:acetolactate decarboxylase